MLDVVSQWVAHYGYIMVALFLLIEGAGVPVPGETALVTAAALAGRGTLSLTGVLIALSFWRTRPGFIKHAFATNTVLMTAGFVLVGTQLSGYFLTSP